MAYRPIGCLFHYTEFRLVLLLVLVGVTLFISIPNQQDISYYHMISDEDYQAGECHNSDLTEVRNNVYLLKKADSGI